MTTDYTIDISKNVAPEFKKAKRRSLIYMYGYLFVLCFYMGYTIIISKDWTNYKLGIITFFAFSITYLQINGKWIYKRYVSITLEGFKWQKQLFERGNIKWVVVNKINFNQSFIYFTLATNKVKSFSLSNITEQQIIELKEMLNQLAAEKGITVIAS